MQAAGALVRERVEGVEVVEGVARHVTGLLDLESMESEDPAAANKTVSSLLPHLGSGTSNPFVCCRLLRAKCATVL